MIEFFNEHLAQPELCRLLYLTVPEEIHVPVVFYDQYLEEGIEFGFLGDCSANGINIYLGNAAACAARFANSGSL
ncbi:MAG: hypothetical protein ACYC4L_19260, partial [Chloroflexota bacterium]